MADARRMAPTSPARRSEIFVAVGVIVVIGMMIIPLPEVMLDALMAANIVLSLLIILIILYTRRALEAIPAISRTLTKEVIFTRLTILRISARIFRKAIRPITKILNTDLARLKAASPEKKARLKKRPKRGMMRLKSGVIGFTAKRNPT